MMTLTISCGMASLIPYFRFFPRMFGGARRAGLSGRSDWNGQSSDLAALKPDRAVCRVHILVIDQAKPKRRIEQTSQFSLSIFARTLCLMIPSRRMSRVIIDCFSRTDKIYRPTLVGGLRCCEHCSTPDIASTAFRALSRYSSQIKVLPLNPRNLVCQKSHRALHEPLWPVHSDAASTDSCPDSFLVLPFDRVVMTGHKLQW
jgi:hypothetical protein